MAAGVDFAIAAPRNSVLWRAYVAVDEKAWTDARDMTGAQVAATGYAPAGWPPGTYTIIHRVKIPAGEISTDSRSRRRCTIPKDQLTLALDGITDHAWAVSFIVTNITANDPDGLVAVEHWFRGRADIETQIKDHKLGAGLRHLPSADPAVNQVWMWAAILAGWLSGDRCGQAEKTKEIQPVTFIAHGQPAVVVKPRDRPFDLPPMSAKTFGTVHPAPGGPCADAASVQEPAQALLVVGLVSPHLDGSASPRPTRGTDRRDTRDQRDQGMAVVQVRPGDRHDQRQPLGIGQHRNFRTRFAAIDRVWTDQSAPFFARRLAASTITDDQSTRPAPPWASRTSRCSRGRTPARVHVWNRRCAVGTDTPNSVGRCRHAQPAVST